MPQFIQPNIMNNNQNYDNKSSIKLLDKKRKQNKEKNELKNKIEDINTSFDKNLKENSISELKMPQFVQPNIMNNNQNYNKSSIKLLDKKRKQNKEKNELKNKIEDINTSFDKNLKENSISELKTSMFVMQSNVNSKNDINNRKEENTTTKKLKNYKNKLEKKIRYLKIAKDELEKNIPNKGKGVFNDQLKKILNTINSIKLFYYKFNEKINDESNKEYKKNVNKKLIESISNTLNDFKKTYSNFLEKDFEKIDMSDVKNEIFNRLNKTIPNKNIFKNYYDEKTLAKEKFKNNILMKIFTNNLKDQYTELANSFLSKNNNNNLLKSEELKLVRNTNQNAPNAIQKPYDIYVYFPHQFLESINNRFNLFYNYLKLNTKIIIGNAAINTMKYLRWASALNIRLGIKDKIIQKAFQKQENYNLTEEDYDEIYNDFSNITVNDDCYNVFADFENSFTTINFGKITEDKRFLKIPSCEISIKNLYNPTVQNI